MTPWESEGDWAQAYLIVGARTFRSVRHWKWMRDGLVWIEYTNGSRHVFWGEEPVWFLAWACYWDHPVSAGKRPVMIGGA